MSKFKGLYLEDDEDTQILLGKHMPENLTMSWAKNIQEANDLLLKENFNLILVDLNLGHESGLDFIESIKDREFAFIPTILVITGSENEEDEVKCHQANVFEFIKKPIRMLPLKAQLEKHLERFKSMQLKRIGCLQIDEAKMEVKNMTGSGEISICLTLKEYQLLMKLLNNPARTYSREELLKEVWQVNSVLNSRTIDMHVSSLRKKLGNAGEAISSVRGVGYMMNLEKIPS